MYTTYESPFAGRTFNIARSSVNSARSAYNSANATYAEYQKQSSQSSKYLANGDTLGYQNYLTDMELQNTKEQNKANQDAYAQATKNTQDMILVSLRIWAHSLLL